MIYGYLDKIRAIITWGQMIKAIDRSTVDSISHLKEL